ncbi:MAG: hypothetical protein SGPRY_009536, partial [Prymnesium sp.]
MASIRRYEHKLATARREGERIDALAKHLATDQMLRENYRSDDRVEKTRELKELQAATKEQYVTNQLETAAASQYREKVIREQDERLAAVISKRKIENTREAKNMQRICEQSEELRELEEKLKAAYMNKEREAQVKESAALVQKKVAEEAEIAAVRLKIRVQVHQSLQRGLQAEGYRDYLRAQDGQAMRRALDQQMAEKEQSKAEAYKEFLKEKDLVDKVVQAIYDEDLAERKARHEKETTIRGYIDHFIKEQEAYKKIKQDEMEAENDKIRQYAEQVMAREQALRIEKQREQNAKDELLDRMSADMAKRQKERDEMENLRNELVIQETEERILQKEKEKMERAVQQRMDIALANEYQRQLKAIRLEKFAEDSRLDQMNSQKRRQKQMDHRREIERLLEERRAKYEAERAAELQEQLDAERVEQIRQQIIEEERKRMLAAHAKNLGLQHLPK